MNHLSVNEALRGRRASAARLTNTARANQRIHSVRSVSVLREGVTEQEVTSAAGETAGPSSRSGRSRWFSFMSVPWTRRAVHNASALRANKTEKCESIVKERAGSQRASGLFLHTHEMRVALCSPIVLVGSLSGASLRVNEAGKKGRGLLQLHAAAAPTQARVSSGRTGNEIMFKFRLSHAQ